MCFEVPGCYEDFVGLSRLIQSPKPKPQTQNPKPKTQNKPNTQNHGPYTYILANAHEAVRLKKLYTPSPKVIATSGLPDLRVYSLGFRI